MARPLKGERPRVEALPEQGRVMLAVEGLGDLDELNMRERREVVRILTERGLTAEKIAAKLRCSDRSVFRWRAHVAHGARCRWALV